VNLTNVFHQLTCVENLKSVNISFKKTCLIFREQTNFSLPT
jgi:hypothetical protein